LVFPESPIAPPAGTPPLTRLRQDRILEEATAAGTRDPMNLASMFGLPPNTAQRYVDAAYGRDDPAPSGAPS
jgi:hypothetical protein